MTTLCKGDEAEIMWLQEENLLLQWEILIELTAG